MTLVPAAPDPTRTLLAALDLVPYPGEPDTFSGVSLPRPGGRVFGGQVLAQALIAAGRTLPDADRPRLVSVGRYALRGVSRAQELFTLDPEMAPAFPPP